jgi:transcriptional regulator with XRE-family HTH domain
VTAPSPRRARLAARLRAVRAARFASGNRFARELGWQQSRVSKLETGTQLPTEDDIRAWVVAAGTDSDTEGELLDMLSATRVEYATWRATFRGRYGAAGKQAQIAAREAQASRVGKYQPAVMLGLVQTAAYARELLALPGGPRDSGDATDEDVEAQIAERIRRQEVLYQTGKQVQLVMGEAALHGVPGTVGTLLGQLTKLASIAELPSVELGIIPLGAVPVMPLGGFAIYDSDLVVSESLAGEQSIDDPEQVALYLKAFDELRAAAVTGADAVALIERVAAGLRARLR